MLATSAIAVNAPAPSVRAEEPLDAATVSDIGQLSDAINAANGTGPKWIYLAPGTYNLAALPANKQLELKADGIHLIGADATTSALAASFVIDGATQRSGLVINADDVVVSGVTIKRTSASNGSGAAITVKRNADRFVLANSSIEYNHARDGGGVTIESNSSATVRGSTFVGNSAVRKGGGIRVDGKLDLFNSTFTLNTAQSGGAISVAGSSAISYSTFVDNLSNNQKGAGVDRNGGSVAITGSILTLADRPSSDGSDCSGNPDLIGPNYVGNAQGCNPDGAVLIGTELGVPLGIQALADNTGPTWTMALNGDSPAVDAAEAVEIDSDGDDEPDGLACRRIEVGGTFGTRVLDVDQRGIPRPADDGCDLGAFETGLVFGLDLTSDPLDPFVGAEYLDANQIGPAIVATDELLSSSLAASPISAFPVEAAPISAFPISAFPISAFPISAFPISAFSASARGLDAFPISAFPMSAFPMSAFPLSDLVLTDAACDPIRVPNGSLGEDEPCTWEAVLAGTDFAGVPLQSITVDDVISEGDVGDLNLGAMNLEGTPISAFPMSAFLLYDLSLSDFPISAFPISAFDGGETYELCEALPEGFCASPEASLASVALAGFPMSAFPMSAFPMSAFPISAFPMSAFPMSAFPISAFRWEATPMSAFPISAFPISAFTSSGSATAVIDCDPTLPESCPDTLGEATFIADASVGDLAAALLASCTGAAPSDPVSNCVPGFPADLSLADLLTGIIPPGSIPWETIDLGTPGLQNAGPDDAWTFDYVVEFTVTDQALVDVDLTLPPRFAYALPSASSLDSTPVTPTAISCAEELPTGSEPTDCVGGSLVVSFDGLDLAPGTHELRIGTRAGFRIEQATARVEATATAGASAVDASDEHTVSVQAPPERGALAINSVGTGCGNSESGVNLGWAAAIDGVDFYTFDVTPEAAACGLRADIYLDNLDVDLDLTLYGTRAASLRGQPDSTMAYLDDVTLDLNPFDDVIQADTVQDIPQRLPTGLYVESEPGSPEVLLEPDQFAVVAISSNRDDAPDRIRTGTLRPGRYVVQVSAYNGAESNDPYTLRIRTDASVTPRACSALDLTGLGETSTRELPQTLPDDVNTLFLVNERMLTFQFGADGRDDVLAALDGPDGLANQPGIGVLGAVIPVDADNTAEEIDDLVPPEGEPGGVAAALAARYEEPCDPFLSNAVVEEIGEVIDRYTDDHDTITNIVIVGDDQQIPMANIVDDANFANERTYSQEFGADENNESTAALSAGLYRSDDPYGTDAGIQVRDHELYVPTRAVGRLVETEDEIIAAVDNYISFGGRLDPGTARDAFQSGYEFLADGANLNADLLDADGYDVDRLIDTDWTDDDLIGALAAGDSSVIGIHAHFDHDDALPASDNFAPGPDDLFNTSELPDAVSQAIVYSMGCHSGWSLSDVQVGGPAPDWPQAVSGSGENVFIGNTGFGYGDTAVVALTEQLTADFAAEIGDDGSIGQAWVNAKQTMVGEILVLDAYQEKAVQQFVFYGLPMFHVGVDPEPIEIGTDAAAPQLLSAAVAGDTTVEVSAALPGQGAGGLGMSEFGITTDDDGSFYDVDGRTLDVNGHPIQPIYVEDVPAQDGSVARDALITELTSIDDPSGEEFDPVFFWASANYGPTDPFGNARPEFFDGSFPAEMAAVRDVVIDGEERQEVVFAAGQYKASDVSPDVGTQRLHTRIKAEIYYVPEDDTDLEPPLIVQSTGEVVPGNGNLFDASFTVEVDEAERVYVLYRGVGVAQWDGVDLAYDGVDGVWKTTAGSAPFFGGAERMEYIVQAVRNGHVSMSNAKSRYFLADTDASLSSMFLTSPQVDPVGAPMPCTNAGWYNGQEDVQVFAAYDELETPAMYEARTKVNASAATLTTFDTTKSTLITTLANDGVHVVSALDETGAFDSCSVRIDRTPPEPTISPVAPSVGDWFTQPVDVSFDATDELSGLESLSYTIDGIKTVIADLSALPTVERFMDDGEFMVTADAMDAAGNPGSVGPFTIRIDQTPPTVTEVTGLPDSTLGLDQPVTIGAMCEDVTSGVQTCLLSISGPGGNVVTDHDALDGPYMFTPGAPGTYQVTVLATDNAGLTTTVPDPESEEPLIFVVADDEDPTVGITTEPANPNTDGWFGGSVAVTITADDNDAVASLTYVVVPSTDPCPATSSLTNSYATPFPLGEGRHKVCAAAIDPAGNSATASTTVQVDLTPPTASLDVSRLVLTSGTDMADEADVVFSCSDALSGIRTVDGCTVSVTKDGEPFPIGSSTSPLQLGPGLAVGEYVVTLTATDRAGNATVVSETVTVLSSLCVLEDYNFQQAKNIGTNYTIKIRLCDAAGNDISDRSIVLEAFAITDEDGVEYDPGANDSGKANAQFEFRYSNGSGYTYNLNTTGFTAELEGTEPFTLDFTATRRGEVLGIGRARFTLSP